jgi:hypothetical protein
MVAGTYPPAADPSVPRNPAPRTANSPSSPTGRPNERDGASPIPPLAGQDSSAISPPPAASRSSLAPGPWPLAPASFTTVEEDERRRAEADESERSPAWLQIAMLSVALGAMVVLGFIMMRPPTADALYARIEDTAGSGVRPERLLDAEDDIQKFLTRFPDDPRGTQLKNYTEEIELLRLERRMQLRPALTIGNSADGPIERDYSAAMHDATSDPERAAAKLQAIIDLYGQTPNLSETAARFLELSRRQLSHLIGHISKQAPAYLKLIDENLDRANHLIATDPAKARAIYSSIVELYADKPWAADRVAKARAALNAK